MKIMLVTLEYPPTIGGVSTYLRELYGSLDDHEVVVVSPATHTMSSWWCYPRWLPFYFELRRLVKKEKPDHIHVSHVLPIGLMAHWLHRSLHVPYVLYFHGVDLCAAHMQPRKWPRVREIVAGAHRIVVNSEATRVLFEELCGSEKKVTVIRPGCAPVRTVSHELSDAVRRTYNLGGKRVILFLARLVPRKGLHLALEAFSELVRRHVDAVLLVAGDGPERASAEDFVAQHGLSDRVRFAGRVSDDEKAALFSIASIFWFPAVPRAHDFEGFGITSLEAQSYGCPVVVSNVDGLPESMIDGETGRCVEPQPLAFAEATIVIFNDAPLWQRMRASARLFAQSNAWDARRQQLRALISTDEV